MKNVNGGFVQYVGIAADEPARLTRLDGTSKISLLAEYGYTEQMAYDLCSKYDFLSPYISITKGAVVGSVLTRLTASLHI